MAAYPPILLLLANLNYSGLEPASPRMVRIHTVIQVHMVTRLPLFEDSSRVEWYLLIVLDRPSSIMYIDGCGAYKHDFSIHPLIDGIKDIDIFPSMKCVF